MASSRLFVSYAHADLDYTQRLCTQLAAHGLPVWSDSHLEIGDDFVVDIQRIVRDCCGMIVVMSPESARSRFVRIEILEGWVNDRPFLPILLSGDVHFLLRSTQFFDGRGGALPGEREIRKMRSLCGSDGTPLAYPTTPVAPMRPAIVPPAFPSADPAGEPPAWTDELAALLADRKFGPADVLTTSLLLDAAHRLAAGWMQRGDARRITADRLARIDRLWWDNSDGRFGYTRQQKLAGPAPGGAPVGGSQHFFALARAFGWQLGEQDVIPRRYGEFVAAGRHPGGFPEGFFPTMRNAQISHDGTWLQQWHQSVMAVFSRFADTRGTS